MASSKPKIPWTDIQLQQFLSCILKVKAHLKTTETYQAKFEKVVTELWLKPGGPFHEFSPPKWDSAQQHFRRELDVFCKKFAVGTSKTPINTSGLSGDIQSNFNENEKLLYQMAKVIEDTATAREEDRAKVRRKISWFLLNQD